MPYHISRAGRGTKIRETVIHGCTNGTSHNNRTKYSLMHGRDTEGGRAAVCSGIKEASGWSADTSMFYWLRLDRLAIDTHKAWSTHACMPPYRAPACVFNWELNLIKQWSTVWSIKQWSTVWSIKQWSTMWSIAWTNDPQCEVLNNDPQCEVLHEPMIHNVKY